MIELEIQNTIANLFENHLDPKRTAGIHCHEADGNYYVQSDLHVFWSIHWMESM